MPLFCLLLFMVHGLWVWGSVLVTPNFHERRVRSMFRVAPCWLSSCLSSPY